MKVLRFSHYVPVESSSPQPNTPQDTPASLQVQQAQNTLLTPPQPPFPMDLPQASTAQDAFTPQMMPVSPSVPVSALKFGQAGQKSLLQKAIDRIFSS